MTVSRSVASEVVAADLSVGDFIEAYDGYGEVGEVVPHGASIGDGTEEWNHLPRLFPRPDHRPSRVVLDDCRAVAREQESEVLVTMTDHLGLSVDSRLDDLKGRVRRRARGHGRPTARELDHAADHAQDVFWRYVRVAEFEEPPVDMWDEVCMAMGKLADLVRDRRRR